MFQHGGSHNLKDTTIKGKNMLLIGSIFFPLKVVPVRIDNNFEGHLIGKTAKKNFGKCSKITNTKKLLFFPLFVILEITFMKKCQCSKF